MILKPAIVELPEGVILKKIIEANDYDIFLPKTLFKNLCYALCFNIVESDPYKCLQEPLVKEDIMFKEVLDLIAFDRLRVKDPVEAALNILKLLSPKINYKEYELGNLKIDDKCLQQNYSIDIKDKVPPIVLDLLNIKLNPEPNTTVLPKSVLEILKLYDGLTFLPSKIDVEFTRSIVRMKSYSEANKAKLLSIASPIFRYNLAKKDLYVKSYSKITNEKSDVIIAIDITIKASANYDNIVKACIAYYTTKFGSKKATIDIVFFTKSIVKILTISNLEDLKRLIDSDYSSYATTSSVTNVIPEISKKYSNRSVIIITGGSLVFNKFAYIKNKFYGLTIKDNKPLKEVCISSGGKYRWY